MPEIARNCLKLKKSRKLPKIENANFIQFNPISSNFHQFCTTFATFFTLTFYFNRPKFPLLDKRLKIFTLAQFSSISSNFNQFSSIFINFPQFYSIFQHFLIICNKFLIRFYQFFLKLLEIASNCMKLRKLPQIASNCLKLL